MAAHPPIEWHAEKDDGGSGDGVARLVDEAEDDDHHGGEDEEDRRDGVAVDAIGARDVGLAAAEDEDRGGGERVKEPLRNDGQREERLEFADHEKQERTEDGLQDEACGGRLEAWMDGGE